MTEKHKKVLVRGRGMGGAGLPREIRGPFDHEVQTMVLDMFSPGQSPNSVRVLDPRAPGSFSLSENVRLVQCTCPSYDGAVARSGPGETWIYIRTRAHF